MTYSPAPGSVEYDRFVAYQRTNGATLAQKASTTEDEDVRHALVAHDAEALVYAYQRADKDVRPILMMALHVGALLSVADAAEIEDRMRAAVDSLNPSSVPPGFAA